jgi:hypothetical protein
MFPITVRKDRVPMDIIIENKFKQHRKDPYDTNKQFKEILIHHRFRYYIKNWTNKQFIKIPEEAKQFKQNELIFYPGPYRASPNHFPLNSGCWEQMFWWNQKELPLDIPCLTISADGINNRHLPAIVKVRYINTPKGGIIAPLEHNRHWKPIHVAKKNKILWQDKISDCIWRGASTGKCHKNERVLFCYKWSQRYNVGISKFCQGVNPDARINKKNKSIDEMLKYKYIISIPGNDKDSGLNWKLASKSLVLMAQPKIESWLMEGLLKPYVHYVPLKDDYSDLEEQINWCKLYDDKCREIVKKANKFMQQFEDIEIEKKIFDMIKEHYKKTFIFG